MTKTYDKFVDAKPGAITSAEAMGTALYRRNSSLSGSRRRKKRFRFFFGGLVGGFSVAGIGTQVVAALPLAEGILAGAAIGVGTIAVTGVVEARLPTELAGSFSAGMRTGAIVSAAVTTLGMLASLRGNTGSPGVASSAAGLRSYSTKRALIENASPAAALALELLGIW